MKRNHLISRVCHVDATDVVAQNGRLISPGASVAGREAGSLQPASAFLEKESAECLFSPRPGQGSPALGANRSNLKKRHPAFAGCQFKLKGSVWRGGSGDLYPVTLYSRNMELMSVDFAKDSSPKERQKQGQNHASSENTLIRPEI